MKFGLIYTFRNPPQWRKQTPRFYGEMLEHAQEMEHLGFDVLHISEHHFIDDEYLPSIFPVAAAFAARTRTVRLASAAVILPLQHPLRIAEDTLVVDQISDGRFDLGVCLGYRVEEFEAFGVSRSDRARLMDEGLAILTSALNGEPVKINGSTVGVTPNPSRGAIKIYVASRAPRPSIRAARFRCHLMPLGGRDAYQAYATQLAAQGDDPNDFDVCGFLHWFVTEDPERDWERLKPHALYQEETYGEWFDKAGDLPEDRLREGVPESHHLPDFVSTPEQLTERLQAALAASPYTEFTSWAVCPGADVAASIESARLFATKVMPQLKTVMPDRSFVTAETEA